MTFAAALRAFLRQDPDIVMVGEIRDLETAEIAVKAAQTGHLVLSTLHTNDAPQSLTRLANMGVPPFNIASSVLLIMAQRLARKLCTLPRGDDCRARRCSKRASPRTRSPRASPSTSRSAASVRRRLQGPRRHLSR
jgi:type II secretory ATPase GspE/PulE/Tfp pilus assembly ATPase PilB-like protein